ncbi:MAG: CrcB family protein [Ilumatobacter sp.]
MTPALFVLAASLGAVGRHVVASFLCSWHALLGVNTAGAALLGWLATQDLSEPAMTVFGVGFCGALTTFSSFASEVRTMGPRYGALYATTTMLCVCGAASVASSL